MRLKRLGALLALSNLIGVEQLEPFPTGWGYYTAVRGQTPERRFIGLPHLSTFKIMTREPSRPYLDRLFDGS